MKIVKFIKPMNVDGGAYKIGDCASFEDDVTGRLITQGYGEEVSLESTKIPTEIK
jgi:hypothetical protein